MSIADLLATLAAAPVLFVHAFVRCLLMKHRILMVLVVVLTKVECVQALKDQRCRVRGTPARSPCRLTSPAFHTCLRRLVVCTPCFRGNQCLQISVLATVVLSVANSSIRGTICLQASKLEAALAQPDA